MDEKISVIVPVYNVAEYLPACLDSLLGQTYRNLEIVLINDGSTDDSGAICDTYARQDGRIRVYHQENAGLPHTRNRGIELATGALISFIDSDDYVALTLFEHLYREMLAADAPLAICHYLPFQGERCAAEADTPCAPAEAEVIDAHAALKRCMGADGITYNLVWNKLYRRDVIADIRYPPGKINEDEFVAYRFMHNAKRIVVLQNVLYFYRERPGSITARQNYLLNRDIYEALEQRLDDYERWGYTDITGSVKKQILDRHINRYIIAAGRGEAMPGWRDHFRHYRRYYKKYRDSVPGLAYLLFYISPGVYRVLLKLRPHTPDA